MVDDTINRLNYLFDNLNSHTIKGEMTLDLLRKLSSALNAKDYIASMNISVEIMSTNEADMRWAIGLKQLIRLVGSS